MISKKTNAINAGNKLTNKIFRFLVVKTSNGIINVVMTRNRYKKKSFIVIFSGLNILSLIEMKTMKIGGSQDINHFESE